MLQRRPRSFRARSVVSLAVVLMCAVAGLAVAPNASADLNQNCARNAQIPGGAQSYGSWSNSAAYNYAAGQIWCAYNESLNYRVVWQTDGNLVAYSGAHSGGVAVWASNTSGAPGGANTGQTLAFQIDGNVVVYNSAGKWIWSTHTDSVNAPHTYKFSIEVSPSLVADGGTPVISMSYNTDAKPRWSNHFLKLATATDDSGQAIQTGAIPGWKLNYWHDWASPAATPAAMASVYGTSWCPYADGVTDYYKSTVSVHDGLMDFTLDGARGAAGWFATPNNCKQGETYGRYSMRFRTTGAGGYNLANMIWPFNDKWAEGEVDFPEGNMGDQMLLFQHGTNCGTQCAVNVDGYATGVRFDSGWHTVTTEWLPGSLRYYLDGNLIRTETTNVPQTPHRWTLQVSPFGVGQIAQPGHLYIAWVTGSRPA